MYDWLFDGYYWPGVSKLQDCKNSRHSAWYYCAFTFDSWRIWAAIQTIFGGNITLLTSLCERARDDAFDLMLRHAEQLGANAIIGMRYDTCDLTGRGVSEVLAYGTAVVVELK